jgi:hypothetical protein
MWIPFAEATEASVRYFVKIEEKTRFLQIIQNVRN